MRRKGPWRSWRSELPTGPESEMTCAVDHARRRDIATEEADLRGQVRAFLRDQLDSGAFVPRCDAWLAGFSPEFSRELGLRGWIGLTIPRKYGGHERSALSRYVVIEELLAAGAPVAAHWFADRQFAPSLLAYGTESQKLKYLPSIARGECFFAIGMSEADAGSDLAGLRTKAERTTDGWRLTGSKLWTSGAHHAHAIVVLARTTPHSDGASRHEGLSQFIVDLPANGVQINPIRLLTGEHHFNEVVFDDVYVNDEQVLGSVGEGWQQVTAELAYERSGPERYLSTFPLLEILVRRVDRVEDSRHIVGVIGGLLARAWTLRQLSYEIARALADGESPEIEAAMVKDLGTTFEQDLADVLLNAIEVPADLRSADPLQRALAEAVLHSPGYTIRGGTNEVLRGVVARSLGLR